MRLHDEPALDENAYFGVGFSMEKHAAVFVPGGMNKESIVKTYFKSSTWFKLSWVPAMACMARHHVSQNLQFFQLSPKLKHYPR